VVVVEPSPVHQGRSEHKGVQGNGAEAAISAAWPINPAFSCNSEATEPVGQLTSA
jgi:hypothetical protein